MVGIHLTGKWGLGGTVSVVDKLDPSDASAPSMFSKAFHCLGRNRGCQLKATNFCPIYSWFLQKQCWGETWIFSGLRLPKNARQVFRGGSWFCDWGSGLILSWVHRARTGYDWATDPFLSSCGSSDGKESACSARDQDSIPEFGRSPGGDNSNLPSTLAWEIPCTEESDGLQPMGLQANMAEQQTLSPLSNQF